MDLNVEDLLSFFISAMLNFHSSLYIELGIKYFVVSLVIDLVEFFS